MGTDAGRRRRTSRMVTLACAGILLLPVTACAAEPSPAPTSAPPTAAPIFATDEEALAAAEEAYANYLSTYDASWADGDGSLDDYLALTVGEAHQTDEQSYAEWDSKNWRPIGTTKFDSIRLQSRSQDESGIWHIQTYLCIDVSDGDVVDSSGASVARPDRPLRLPLEVSFVTVSRSSAELKISESEVWSGTNFC